MNDTSQQLAAREFAQTWQNASYEKGQTQLFWSTLLQRVYDIKQPELFISFENQIKIRKSDKNTTNFIDAYIRKTRVLIEQKNGDTDLSAPVKQSDGEFLTPFQQAQRYTAYLAYSKKPRWIVTCNFKEFRIYDLDLQDPESQPEIIQLADLEREYARLTFLVDPGDAFIQKELELSLQAGELVGKLYDALLKLYPDPDDPASLKNLNILCVRLVFCLYAEDAGIFGQHLMFHKFIKDTAQDQVSDALEKLFEILNTPENQRKVHSKAMLAFPYIDGGLFENQEDFSVPYFTQEVIDLLTNEMSATFNWSGISPTIFGAIFESTLNPVTRRQGGMHYTSFENIHKVIDPLFLDDLQLEFTTIKNSKSSAKNRLAKLKQFITKLASLKFFDPACGSGNFLTETYISLRRLENSALEIIYGTQPKLIQPVKVNIGQFYGIEINDFAVAVAQTALWIAESQMYNETEDIYHQEQDYLPLTRKATIVEANALQTDWSEIIQPDQVNYILGNPPFVGARWKNTKQKEDLLQVFGRKWPHVGDLDYVCGWFKKASDFITGQNVRVAFVATNSLCQGSSVGNFWKHLFVEGVHIDFAYQSFRWESESLYKSHVFCIIVAFSKINLQIQRLIFTGHKKIVAQNINGYLLDFANICVESRNQPLCDVPRLAIGNKPIDGGFYLFTEKEKNKFLKKEPQAEKWFKKWYGAKEFLDNKPRYYLFLQNCSPAELQKMPLCMKRISAVKQYRLQSKSEGTRQLAERPLHFHVENIPTGNYIIVPEITSEYRKYIPIDFQTPDILCSNRLKLIQNATLYHFGILTSIVHNIWIRIISGRLGTSYIYSIHIVYNNFPWPHVTEKQQNTIMELAQGILDARKLYPESSLADLYNPLTMPDPLRQAHDKLDKTVLKLYGLKTGVTEQEIITKLFEMYVELTK